MNLLIFFPFFRCMYCGGKAKQHDVSFSCVCYEDMATNKWQMRLMRWTPNSCEILSILTLFSRNIRVCLTCFAPRAAFPVSLRGLMSCDVRRTHLTQTWTQMQTHWVRPPLIKEPFSLLSSSCLALCPAETKRWGQRNGQLLIKFPPLFLSVPPMLFSYRFRAPALCNSQENKQAFRRGARILLFKCFFSI